ncbi:MAG: short chain dehydrogenase [bacterium]|nr:short chain dehydrogenase [bacterium]
MKIILVGANGNIGREVDKALSPRHEVVRVGSRSGDVRCDYTDAAAVQAMFAQIGAFDALITVVGNDSVFKPYAELSEADYLYGFEHKFLSQIRLLKLGEPFVRDRGVFLFSSGFLSHYPHPMSCATGPLNAAIDAFVQTTAPLLPRGIRLNVISPAPVVEPGREGRGLLTAQQAAQYYVQAVEGDMTGKVLRAWAGLPFNAE